jgi:hypothetical protein
VSKAPGALVVPRRSVARRRWLQLRGGDPRSRSRASRVPSWCLGRRRGRRVSDVDPFTYEEELEFGNVGKPYLTYRQRTWLVQEDERVPSHMEFAFWRPRPGGLLEVISAHPNGVAEIEVGTVERSRVALRSFRVVTSASAKDVVRLERDFVVTDDVLAYEVRMEAVGQGLGPHLRAELRRRA